MGVWEKAPVKRNISRWYEHHRQARVMRYFLNAKGPQKRECHMQKAIATLQGIETWLALKRRVRIMLMTDRSPWAFGKSHDCISTA